MTDPSDSKPVTLNIAAVERDTGLSKDTLRVWERRYGFPSPERDQFGERVYSLDQIEKLRVVRRLLDLGHRPGRIMRHSIDQLHQLASLAVDSSAPPAVSADGRDPDLERYLDLAVSHQVEQLRQMLGRASLRLGVEQFVTSVAAPLTRLVGDAWARGDLRVFEEHLLTESITVTLRNAMSGIPQQQPGAPRILLTTLPNEPHKMGLLMVEALMLLDGCRCYSLGSETPVVEIVAAAGALQVDIVALSLTGCLNPGVVIQAVAQLREQLPGSVQLWVGGQCPGLARRRPQGVRVISELSALGPSLATWRELHGC